MKATPKSLFAMLIFFTSLAGFSQEKQRLSGTVVDEKTQSPLWGANLYLVESSLGTISNKDGTFTLPKLPSGSYQLEVSYIGYSSQKVDFQIPTQNNNLKIALNQEAVSGPMVTITATRARERESSVTHSMLTKTELNARHTIEDIPEIISEMPSTTFYSESGNGLGYNFLSIRGFGQRRISVLINGIPQNDPEDHNVYWLDFPDFAANVQNIQVQRGAGSAFYGPAAIGGSINIISNYFSPERNIEATYGYGSYDTKKASLSYNSGLLNDKFVVFARASNIQSDGYRNNAWVDFWSFFLGGAYYTENSSTRLHIYGGPIEDGFAYYGIPKEFNDDKELRKTNYFRDEEIENFNQPHFELLNEYRISPNLTLNNNFFYIKGYGFFDYDGSWGTPEYFRLTPEYGYSQVESIPGDALIRAYVNNDHGGWLPNLTWKHPSGELIAGAELRVHRSLHWGRLQGGTGLPGEVVGDDARRYYEYNGAKDIASIYVHETYHVTDRLNAVADVQYAYKKYRLYNEKFLDNEFSIPNHFINPRVGVNYNMTDAANVYASVSQTTREPRLKNYYDAAEASSPELWGAVRPQFEQNEDGSFDFDEPLVSPEKLFDYELGFGYRTNRLRGFVNFYYMDFDDEIIKSGQVDRFGQPITGNAEQTRHLGVELGGNVQILPQLSLSGNLLFSQNELVKYSEFDWGGEESVLDGNQIAGFPNTLANARLTYSWKELYASLQARYVGRQYTDNYQTKENSTEPFSLFNFNLRYKLSRLGLPGVAVSARVNNILNKKYLAYGEGDAFWPGATRNVFFGVNYNLNQ